MAVSTHQRVDVYSRVTNQIIEAIEAGAGTWRMPWHTGNVPLTLPFNVSTNDHYRGVNVLSLWAQSQLCGYQESVWGTYKQWSALERQVAAGQKGTLGIFWKQIAAREPQLDLAKSEADAEGAFKGRWIASGFTLFNIAQLEDYEPVTRPEQLAHKRIAKAEQFFGHVGVDLRHGGDRAFYHPSLDYIQMPPRSAFSDTIAYYSTLAHEVTHWTGHASRLDRDLSGRMGSPDYAMEELVAELGSAFVSADLGLEAELRPDHAAYIDHWLRLLKSNSRAIFSASSQAQRAAEFLTGLQPKHHPELNGARIPVAILAP